MAGEEEQQDGFEWEDLVNDTVGGTAPEETPEEPAVNTDTTTDEAAAAAQAEQQRMVPINALHEARQQNRELREQLNQMNSTLYQELQQMRQERSQAQQQPPAEGDQSVEWNDDPRGYIDSKFSKIEKMLSQQSEKTQQFDQQAQQEQQLRTLNQAIAADHEKFESQHADVSDAIMYARRLRTEELLEMGLTEIQARQAVNNEELTIAAVALQNGKSPAEVAYNRARRFGYQPTTQSTGETAQAGDQGVNEEQQERREEAQGMGGSGGPSVQDLLDADEDEFDQFFKENGFGPRMK